MDIAELAERHAGVLSTAKLLMSGSTTAQIRKAVTDGYLIRLRHGWYQVTDADATVVAVVAGGASDRASQEDVVATPVLQVGEHHTETAIDPADPVARTGGRGAAFAC